MKGQAIATIQPVKKAVAAAPGREVGKSGSPGRLPEKVDPTQAARVVNEFQMDTVEIDTRPEPLAVRSTLLVLGALVIFAITWASITQIDRLVSAQGKMVSTVPNVIVQPFETAIVRAINVRVGDVVKAGAELATLDPTFVQSDLGQIEARIASLDAQIARLEAEKAGQPYAPAANSAYDYAELQAAIWRERRSQYESQMRVYEERMARARTNIVSSEAERGHLTERLKIVRDIEQMRMTLERNETGSKLNSLIARDSRVEIERSLARITNAVIENRHELMALESEVEVFRRQWETRLVEELVTKRNERDGNLELLAKARRRQEMVALTTPIDAIVLEIGQRSVGSIVNTGEAFFKLVPLDAPLEVEAQILAREIGYVAEGDPVEIKIEAFDFRQHGMLQGVVKVISSDSFTDSRPTPDSPQGAYYRARIEITANNLRNVPGTARLIPGMPLSAEIKVGTRRVIEYFLRPILRGMNESMREP